MTKDELIASINYNKEELLKCRFNIKNEFIQFEVLTLLKKINKVKYNYKKTTLISLKGESEAMLYRCLFANKCN